jgi:hypothetical protein
MKSVGQQAVSCTTVVDLKRQIHKRAPHHVFAPLPQRFGARYPASLITIPMASTLLISES